MSPDSSGAGPRSPGAVQRVVVLLRRLAGARPSMSVESLALLAAGFFTLFCNAPLFRAVEATGVLAGPGGRLTGLSLLLLLAALNTALMLLLLNRWTAKPMLALLLLATAAAVHFMGRYTVYIDPEMVRNVLQSDRRESGELMSSDLLLSVAGLGLLPALLAWRVRLLHRPLGRAALVRSVCLAVALLVAAGSVLASFKSVSALMRNHRELRHLATPGNYLVSLARVALADTTARNLPRTPVGVDARIAGRAPGARPRLLVLVVGETVRAQNWGLNGYARDTTPELRRIDPVNFRWVESCGTSTEVSLPCMFAPEGRADYSRKKARNSESLLHALERAGVATLWRDNQSGCKGVCEGLAYESTQAPGDAPACGEDGCLDEVLLEGLQQAIDRQPGDAVIVLHQLGNHGPAYVRRYPPAFRRFAPECRSPELGRCSREEIVNAYDNAVLYTDHFLAAAIRLLAGQASRDTALIYVSDHGESLGEGGLYLHGMPYAIAPETQTRVPMVMWLSPGLTRSRAIDSGCLRDEAQRIRASHDNLFHTVLGLMQVQASEYDPALDLLGRCAEARGGPDRS